MIGRKTARPEPRQAVWVVKATEVLLGIDNSQSEMSVTALGRAEVGPHTWICVMELRAWPRSPRLAVFARMPRLFIGNCRQLD
jgi:hypothetical protein